MEQDRQSSAGHRAGTPGGQQVGDGRRLIAVQDELFGLPHLHLGEGTAKAVTISPVGTKTCKVSIQGIDGIEHAAQVSASTLYEAVALGIRAIEKDGWSGEIPGGITTATVCAQEPSVQHKNQIQSMKRWIEQPGTTPADRIARQRIREILAK